MINLITLWPLNAVLHEYRVQGSSTITKIIIGNLTEINEKIIPFFEKYPLKGAKLKDFEDFCKVADIKKVDGHLTELGLEQIRLIKMGMNRGRTRS